jgi:hypothetical protein
MYSWLTSPDVQYTGQSTIRGRVCNVFTLKTSSFVGSVAFQGNTLVSYNSTVTFGSVFSTTMFYYYDDIVVATPPKHLMQAPQRCYGPGMLCMSTRFAALDSMLVIDWRHTTTTLLLLLLLLLRPVLLDTTRPAWNHQEHDHGSIPYRIVLGFGQQEHRFAQWRCCIHLYNDWYVVSEFCTVVGPI